MLDLEQQNRLRERYRRLNPTWRPATETYAALIRSYLQPSSALLDIGCGRGGVIEQIDLPAHQITGVDADMQSLRAHRLHAVSLAAAVSQALPFSEGSFDLVLASWVLEHLTDAEATFEQIFHVLKAGGVFVFITPNGRHPAALLNRLLGRISGFQDVLVKTLYGRDAGDTFPTVYHANSPELISKLARSAGFQITTLVTVPDPTYLAFNERLFGLACRFEAALPPSRHVHLVGVLKRPL
jgi:ubiquinone/menaquinone biosynthesis C-methylase UbiE